MMLEVVCPGSGDPAELGLGDAAQQDQGGAGVQAQLLRPAGHQRHPCTV